LISRYEAVAVPFMIIALAASVTAAPRVGVVVVLVTLAIAVPTTLIARQADHAYPNMRAAVGFIAQKWQPGEVLVAGSGYPGLPDSLGYYATQLLPHYAQVRQSGRLRVTVAMKLIRRVGLITGSMGSIEQLAGPFARPPWRVIAAKPIGGTVPMEAIVVARP
jgi:hypothetical protein